MPSQTFLNLPLEKQKNLVRAAFNEFSKVSFYDASINNIIAEAKISRGSFYMYFKDKEDLYKYLLETHGKNFNKLVIECLKANNGDLKLAFIELFDKIIDYICQKNHINFMSKFFSNLSVKTEGLIFPKHDPECHKNNIQDIIDNINSTNLNINSKEEIYEIFDILVKLMIPSIIHLTGENDSKIETRENFKRKLEIICRGIYRKEEI